MTKQRGRGGKRGRKAKKGFASKRELAYKEDGQEYGQILKMLGNGSATVYCFDGKQRLGVICGKMRNRVWISPNDIVLVSLREFEDGGKKCDILHKYFSEEAKQLKALGELPENTVIEERTAEEEGIDNINLKFEEGSEDEEYDGEDDDDMDLPPGSSDEEFWEKEKKKEIQKNEDKKARKEKGGDDEDEESEEEEKPAKVAPKDAGKKPISNIAGAKKTDDKKAPSKVDAKKNEKQKKQDQKKKGRGGDDSDSEDEKDKLDDI